jgi:hypothetical protein
MNEVTSIDDWDLILEDIQNQRCIVILGPDVVEYAGYPSFFDAVSAELTDNKFISQSFVEEQLFQIKITNPSRAKAEKNDGIRHIAKAMQKVVAQNQSDWNAVASFVKKIPSKVIFSLMPEENTFSTVLGTPIRYYHKNKTSEKEVISDLSIENPIIYNLVGTFSQPESLVFTYDDLFDYLFSILGDNRLPQELQIILKNAERFIFLGVNFSKWYMHLLLKLLASDKNVLAIDDKVPDASRTFVMSRLSLEMIDCTPLSFLDSLTCNCHPGISNTNPSVVVPDSTADVTVVPQDAPVRVFISYAHVDEDFKKELLLTLSPMISQTKEIEIWEDRQIVAGDDWNSDIKEQLTKADLMICLVSKNFLASKFCIEKEVSSAIEQQKYLLPVLLRSCAWKDFPFLSSRQVIPRDNQSIMSFKDQDEAYQKVYEEIKRLVKQIKQERV